MSLTASIGHSFHTVFEHSGHVHRPTARTADVVATDHPAPEPRRTPADVGGNLARYREPVTSGDLVRTMMIGFNGR